ncbi:MAG TPA: hypothetical protein VGR06_24675 [Actinophytocola sp.]|uniref:hypothetical protein n=1 Tax=Actinophytocola sp. TaxID=1872138 RepID=UPI002E0CBA09|nr:hypothetical protein [Actinophytocola sp.]
MARWVLPVVLVAMIATAVGALVARQIYAEPETSPSVVLPSDHPLPPGEQPGDPTVAGTSDAAEHPLYETVRALLQTYFDAINNRRYDQWRTVVTKNLAKISPEKWRADFGSTKDGSIVVRRIENGPVNTARVLLSFTSVQDLEHAPYELPEKCIHWRLVLPFTVEDGTWKLDTGVTNLASQHEACEVP